MNKTHPNFGDIYFAALEADGHVQGGERPVLIAQNNTGNKYSPTIEILPMSSQVEKAIKKKLPTQVVIVATKENGLSRDSVVLGEQPRTINRNQLKMKIGSLQPGDIIRVGRARSIQSPFLAS